MNNEQWRMENGEWRMENGEWGMGDLISVENGIATLFCVPLGTRYNEI